MKRILFFACLFLLLGAGGQAAAVVCTDNFSRSDSADIGSAWDNSYLGGGAMALSSNAISPNTTGQDDLESYNGCLPGPNQFAQVTLSTFTGSSALIAYLLLRTAEVGTDTLYFAEARADLQHTKIFACVTGSCTELATETSNAWTSGDAFKFQIIGSALTVLRNGASVLTATDSNISSGRVGIGGRADGAVTDVVLDDFLMGDVAPPRHRAIIIF